jgi:hypothetical protein
MVIVIATALIVLIVGSVAAGTTLTHVLTKSALRRGLVACGVGFATSSLASVILFLTTRAAFPMSSPHLDQVLTPGVLCSLIAPIVGVLAAKRASARLQKRHLRYGELEGLVCETHKIP